MSSSRRQCRLEVSSPLPSLEISVIDNDFQQVAHGVGSLSQDLDPGIYQLEYRAGPELRRELVSLEPGQTYQTRLSVPVLSAAPVDGTITSHEYQQEAARDASAKHSGGLVVLVRNLAGQEGLPIDATTASRLTLVDSQMSAVRQFAAAAQLDSGKECVTWSVDLPPGGYALRTVRRSSNDDQEETFDQAIWLSQGWQTQVFVANTARGPASESASVHMTERGITWDAFAYGGVEAELALWSLRLGRGVVPERSLQLLLDSKYKNPMLGILGAHCLLLQSEVDLALFDKVLANLQGLVPGHPDVHALLWMGQEARARREGGEPTAPPVVTVTWPPMLMASYAGLIRLDATTPGVIEDGSVAERAAAQLLIQGVWTSWKPLPPIPQAPIDGVVSGAGPAETIEEAMGNGPTMARPTTLGGRLARPTGGVLRGRRRPPKPPRRPVALADLKGATFTDPAMQRIAKYLTDFSQVNELGSLKDISKVVDAPAISRATGLPMASVRRCLGAIGGSW
jgi:hypothetical protein